MKTIHVWITVSIISTVLCSNSSNELLNIKAPLHKKTHNAMIERGQNGRLRRTSTRPLSESMSKNGKEVVYLETPLRESKTPKGEEEVYLETPLQESEPQKGEEVYIETLFQESKAQKGEEEVYLETPLQESEPQKGEEVYIETPLQESKPPRKEEEVYLETPLQESEPQKGEEDVYIETPLQESEPQKGEEVYIETPLQESNPPRKEEEVYLETPLQESEPQKGEEVYIETLFQESKAQKGEEEVYIETPLQGIKPKKGEDEEYIETPLEESNPQKGKKGVNQETQPKPEVGKDKGTESIGEYDDFLSCDWIDPPENGDSFTTCGQGECEVSPDVVHMKHGTERVTRCDPDYQLIQGKERDTCDDGSWSSYDHKCARLTTNVAGNGFHFLYGIVGSKQLTNTTDMGQLYNLLDQLHLANLDTDVPSSQVIPLTKTTGCTEDAQCPDSERCVGQECLDLCPSACGNNSVCRMVKHLPVCSCSPGFTGNPYSSCTKEEEMIETNVYLKPAECRWITKSAYAELPSGSSWGGSIINDTCYTTANQLDPGQFSTLERGEFPYLGVIGDKEFKSRRYGILISEQWFLSTASCSGRHCNEKVKLGIIDNNLRRSALMPEYLVIRDEIHADYDPIKGLHDIGVYKLHIEVRFTQFIRPACLVSEHQNPGTKGIFIGRLNGTLMKTTTKVLPGSACKNASSEGTLFCANPFSSQNNIPTYTGFPLVGPMQKPYCMYGLMGMLTFGKINKPKGYMRISYYVPWIEYKILPTCRPQLPSLPPVGS